MSNAICGGAGLKVKKLLPQASKELTYFPSPYWEGGGIVNIDSIAHPNDTSRPNFFKVANDQDDRLVVITQWVSLHKIISDGLFAIRYEHPWEAMTHTNTRFTSNTLLVLRYSWQRHDELHNKLFHNNPRLELASYQFQHPPVTIPPAYTHSIYLDMLKAQITPGISYDEVFFLLGPPDTFSLRDNKMTWIYETNPINGYAIYFKDEYVYKSY
jgi:hypothetical protein